jgi:hypothetical protein
VHCAVQVWILTRVSLLITHIARHPIYSHPRPASKSPTDPDSPSLMYNVCGHLRPGRLRQPHPAAAASPTSCHREFGSLVYLVGPVETLPTRDLAQSCMKAHCQKSRATRVGQRGQQKAPPAPAAAVATAVTDTGGRNASPSTPGSALASARMGASESAPSTKLPYPWATRGGVAENSLPPVGKRRTLVPWLSQKMHSTGRSHQMKDAGKCTGAGTNRR